jgi:hypothetical protein
MSGYCLEVGTSTADVSWKSNQRSGCKFYSVKKVESWCVQLKAMFFGLFVLI